jgi:adenylate cyclase
MLAIVMGVFRLQTVRAKLTALVALSGIVMLVILPVLSWQTKKQLVDEVDDRVEGVRTSFGTEIDDDLADVEIAVRLISTSGRIHKAVETGDATIANGVAKQFHDIYPDVDILFADKSGHIFAQLGCERPHNALSDVPDLQDVLKGQPFRGMLATGCEAAKPGADLPAYTIALPVDGGGAVVICMPIDKRYLHNASLKLGLELSLVTRGNRDPISKSDHFPEVGVGADNEKPVILEEGDSAWAVARFSPKQFSSGNRQYDVIAALDVTDIRAIVRKNFAVALAALLVSALASLAWGARLAGMMSKALTRVNDALKKLEKQEYVKVDILKTGDELENLADGFNQMVDGLQERDKLRTTFGKYMTEAVMQHLMEGKVQLGGETLKVTIVFTDIRSFTTISEKMEAHALVGLLNEYFTDMVSVIMKEDGVVDKYIGDAIMAVFGAPVPKSDDAIRAVRAAVHMRVGLAKLNERLAARGIAPIKTGIGIHTGEVVAGNIGSDARMEYTVIGDAVNLASRLESNTKEVGADILISEDTYAEVKDKIEAKPVRELTVKGRVQPVMTYEVTGLKGGPMLKDLQKSERPSSAKDVNKSAADA